MEQQYITEVNDILNKYKFTQGESKDFWQIIKPIFINQNFQKRMGLDFPHHDNVSLGHHIVSDAAVTYKICQKQKYKNIVDIYKAVVIAMFHDLYTLPWQNNPENFQKYSYNGHGYRHPLEAVVNAISWFPEYFEEEKQTEILIDGIIHHMFPFPVRRFDGTDLELKNEELYNKLPEYIKSLIEQSSNRGLHIKHWSICQSKFIEGRIMSTSDKKVAIVDDTLETIKKHGFKSFYSFLALATGNNKNLDGYEETKTFKRNRK